jgi:hypothetical protein
VTKVVNYELLNSVIRSDFMAFAHKAFATLAPGREFVVAAYIRFVVDKLMSIENGDRTNGIILNLPPRHLKSILISVAYVMWRLGQDPTLQIINISHNEELARHHSLNRRRLIESKWYKAAFPKTGLRTDSNRIDQFQTTSGGGYYARSLNDSVIGLSADIIILDDPQTPAGVLSLADREGAKEIYDCAVSTRFNDRRRGIVIVATQRLHGDDLSAYLSTKGIEIAGGN